MGDLQRASYDVAKYQIGAPIALRAGPICGPVSIHLRRVLIAAAGVEPAILLPRPGYEPGGETVPHRRAVLWCVVSFLETVGADGKAKVRLGCSRCPGASKRIDRVAVAGKQRAKNAYFLQKSLGCGSGVVVSRGVMRDCLGSGGRIRRLTPVVSVWRIKWTRQSPNRPWGARPRIG